MEYWFRDCRAMDYELTHQLLLEKFCGDGGFVRELSGVANDAVDHVEREPDRGRFDLKIALRSGRHLWVEIKMWSGLTDTQYQKQVAAIKERPGDLGIYILLGSSWIERTAEDMIGEPLRWISYPQLAVALDRIIGAVDADRLHREMALLYRDSLVVQHEWLLGLYRDLEREPSQLTYYSYFQHMRGYLSDIRTGIYSEHKGASQYIMHVKDNWLPIALEDGSGYLYLEIIDHEISIRFAHKEGDRGMIRRRLVNHYLPLIQKMSPDAHARGKASKFMRIVRMDLCYSPESVKANADILRDWMMCMREHPIAARA